MKRNLLLTLTGALLMKSALATPTIYPKDVSLLSKVINTTTSNIIADDGDERIIWVLPPNTAYAKVKGLHTITSNVGFCKEMSDLQTYSRNLAAKMRDIQIQRDELDSDLDAKRERLSKARQDYARYVAVNNLEAINQIDDRIAVLDAAIERLTGSLNTCDNDCSEISSQIREQRKERVSLANQRKGLVKDKLRAVRDMERMKASVSGFEKDIEEAEVRWEKVQQNLTEIKELFVKMYNDFGKMEGARASLSFESNWDSNIQELSRMNPGFVFNRIHTQNAVITSNMMGNTNLPGNSAVLGYEIGGNYVEGKMSLSSYPPALSGNIRLSLIGACPVIYPELFNFKLPNGTNEMKYGMLITYEFPSTFDMDVTATYNMYKMYQKVVKSKKRGGFFSSSRKTSVEEKNFFRDEFKVVWNEQDRANSLTEEQRADYEKELRDNIFGRLAAVGLPTLPNPGELVAPETGPNGAAVLASSLAKNPSCKANKWCVAATIGVNVLNAVFGSSTSANSYTNIQDIQMTERWSRKQVVYKPWISSYQ